MTNQVHTSTPYHHSSSSSSSSLSSAASSHCMDVRNKYGIVDSDIDDNDLQKRFTSLPDLLTRIAVDILFTDVCTPLLDSFLTQHIDLVEFHQYLRNRWDEFRVNDADKTFNPSQE